MEFCKDRVFTSLNADELSAGDKVIVSYNLYGLKEQVKMFTESAIDVIEVVQDEDYFNRFKIKHGESYSLAYLVERHHSCANCGSHEVCGYVQNVSKFACLNRCENWKPKTEQKAEPTYKWVKYRPFANTDELIKVWNEKGGKWQKRELTMPHIWVQSKNSSMGLDNSGVLITGYFGTGVTVDGQLYSMSALFDELVFLDGSPCGVEE